jgi:hypothetical protein
MKRILNEDYVSITPSQALVNKDLLEKDIRDASADTANSAVAV